MRDGLYTVYDCRLVGDTAVKLYVCGGGEGAYLGLAIPENGHLHLRKRLSRLDMCTFPQSVEYISDTAPAPAPAPEPEPAPEPPEEDDFLWYSYPDGTLTAFDGVNRYIALPYDRADAGGGIQRTIDGKKYIVFPGRKR